MKSAPNEEPFKSGGYNTDAGREYEKVAGEKIAQLATTASEDFSTIPSIPELITGLQGEMFAFRQNFEAIKLEQERLQREAKEKLEQELARIATEFAAEEAKIADLEFVSDELYEFRQIQSSLNYAVRYENLEDAQRLYAQGVEMVQTIIATSAQRVTEFTALETRANVVLPILLDILQENGKYYEIPSNDDSDNARRYRENIEYYLNRRDAERIAGYLTQGEELIADLDAYIQSLQQKRNRQEEKQRVTKAAATAPANGLTGLENLFGGVEVKTGKR